jgi:hypothetical protein
MSVQETQNIYKQSPLNKSREDKFFLVLNLPEALLRIRKEDLRKSNSIQLDPLQLSIFGTVVPDIVVPGVENRFSGSTYYISSHQKKPFPPLNVNFKIDNEFNNYWIIYKWLDLLHHEKAGNYDKDNLVERLSSDPKNLKYDLQEYQTDLTLYGLDEYNQKRISFKYTKAFPLKLGGIKYDYKNAEELSSNVEFAFSQLHATLL